MIERHVTFHVLPGKEQAFHHFFKQEYLPAMAKTPGFGNATMLRDRGAQSDMKMVLRFETVEAASEWRASAAHSALKPRLKEHYDGSDLKVYDVLD
jgi:antibiotic biosynthesis monooxygenase (ABM) superfamily enzyme